MSWTLARIVKSLYTRGRVVVVVFLGTYTTLVQSCMSYGSLTLSQSTPCRLSVYVTGPKLCKYYSNLPIDRLNKHIDIEPMVILVHRL